MRNDSSQPLDVPPVWTSVKWCVVFCIVLHAFKVMVEQTIQYVPMQDDIGFLRLKRHLHHVGYWKVAFYAHVFTSILTLLAMLTQFVPIRTPRMARVHRWAGRVYAGVILLIAAPSGAVLAWHAEGGLVGRTGFGTLTFLWTITTLLGLWTAIHRKLVDHRAWMTRSFALTLSAVTLREWQFWLDQWLPRHIDIDPITAWLGWLPNLLIAELWLRWMAQQRSRKVRQVM